MMMSVEKLNYIKSLKHILMGFTEVVSTTEVTGIAIDSRKVKPGNLFLAYRGTNHNGLDYIPDAIEAGAVAVVIDEAETAALAATVDGAEAEEDDVRLVRDLVHLLFNVKGVNV